MAQALKRPPDILDTELEDERKKKLRLGRSSFKNNRFFNEEDEAVDDKTEAKPVDIEDTDKKGIFTRTLDRAGEFLREHPTIRRIGQEYLTGTSPELEESQRDLAIRNLESSSSGIHGRLYPDTRKRELDRLKAGGNVQVIGTPESEGSVLPKFGQPESYATGFANSLYEDFIRPLGTPSGVIGSSYIKSPHASAAPIKPPAAQQKLLPGGPRFTANESGNVADTVAGQSLRSREVPYRSDVAAEEAYEEWLRGGPRNPAPGTVLGKGRAARQDLVDAMNPPPDVLDGEILPDRPLAPKTTIQPNDAVRDVVGKGSEVVTKLPGRKVLQDVPPPTAEALPVRKPAMRANLDGTFTPVDQTAATPPTDLTAPPTTSAKKPFVNPFEKKAPIADETSLEPMSARTESGGTRMDIGDRKEMIKIFKNTYSGSVPHVASKELIQNAIDATAPMGPNAKINVDIDFKTKTISVEDNGPGLTRDQIDNEYTNLSTSGKRGGATKTIGELGVGKTTYLVAGEHVEVTSVARTPEGKLVRTTFSGTPEEIIEGFHPVEIEVPEGTPTGTKVTVRTSDKSDFSTLNSYITNMDKYSTNPVNINVNNKAEYRWNSTNKTIPAKSLVTGRPITSGETSGTKYKISIPDDAEWSDGTNTKLILTNRGMFQGVDGAYFGVKSEIPDRILIELDPKVIGTHDDYPLTAPTRERLKDDLRYQITEEIKEKLIKAQQKKRGGELARIYKGLKRTSKGHFIYDGGDRYTPEEFKRVMLSKPIQNIGGEIENTVLELMDLIPSQELNTVERVGFIFDSGNRGVSLRNPEARNEHTLLVNPFSEIAHNNPKQAANGIVHIILHEFTHTDIREEGGNFTAHLATIYEKFDLEKQLEARNNIQKQLEDPNNPGEYTQEIQELLSEYQTARGRNSVSKDLLIREAGSQATEPKGPGGVPRSAKPATRRTNAEYTASAANKLLNSIKENRGMIAEKEAAIRKERARRFANFEGVKETGVAGAKKSLGRLKGEMTETPEELSELRVNKTEADALFNAVKTANITTPEKARGYTALFKLINGEKLPERNELQILDAVFGSGYADKIVEMHGGLGAVKVNAMKTANTMKSLMSSIDLSAPMRQGFGMIHRREWRSAFKEMFKFLADKDYYNAAMESLEQRPNYLLGRDAGLFVSKGDSLIESEEAFMSSYIHNMPGIRTLVGASERAYTGFLNKLRSDTFDTLIKNAATSGVDVSEGSDAVRNIARYINTSTGRGNLGRLEKLAPELNVLLWSPRLLSSRLTVLNPQYYASMDKFTRREALKSLFAMAAAGTTIAALGAASGNKVSTNPLSSDFGKIRRGDRVLDPWAGHQQPIVAAARFIAGANEIRPQTRSATASSFLVNKLSPIAGLAYDLASAKEFTGGAGGNYEDRFGNKKTISREVMNRFVPIVIQDVEELFKSDATFAEQIGLDTASLFGAGVQDYSERKPQRPGMSFGRMRLQ